MSNTLLVSVVIPTYGRSEMLERAIGSVLNQTYDNIEIIVVDDNDSDSEDRRRTEGALQKYLQNDQIVYLKHEKNAGGCVARNTGIDAANGEYIGFLDDDDEWLPEFVVKHLEKMSDNIDIVYCNYFSTKGPNGNMKLAAKADNKRGDVFSDLLTGWCPSTTSMFLVKKECFDNSGNFDESLQSFQDYDMWLTLSKNYKFDYCDEYLIVKYSHEFGQVVRNTVKRQHALETLEHKWKNRLDKKEFVDFRQALRKYQKNIYYFELCKYRENKNFLDSGKKFIDILKFTNDFSLKNISKLLFVLIFGESRLNKIKVLKNKDNIGKSVHCDS